MKYFLYSFFIFIFMGFIFINSSLLFFHLSFKVYIFILYSFYIVIYFFNKKIIKIYYFYIFFVIWLIYAYITILFGYYKQDGFFLLYFLYAISLIYLYVENLKSENLFFRKTSILFRKVIIDSIFVISFLDTFFSYFEYIFKSFGHLHTIKLIPDFLYISNISSIGGFLYQPNLNALLINIGLIITIYKVLESLDLEKLKNLPIKHAPRINLTVQLYILYIFFVIGASLTSSRAGLVAIVSVFLFIYIKKRFFNLEITKKEKWNLIVLFVLYLTIFYFSKYSPVEKFAHGGLIGDNSVDERLMIWLSTILLWFNHPFFGTGLETFKFLNNPYQIQACHILRFPIDMISNFTWTHNEPLQILEEMGIVAFLGIIISTIFYYTQVFRKEKNINNLLLPSLLLIYIVQAGLSWPLRHPALLVLFFIILALINKKTVATLQGWPKNIFVFVLFLVFSVSTIYMLPHIKNDVYYTFKIKAAKNKQEKLNLLYDASQDKYLFWIASSQFVYRAIPYYLQLTTGIRHVPILKEDVENVQLPDNNTEDENRLKKRILEKAMELEKLHKLWLNEYYLGIAYLINGDLKNAKIHAKEAIAINPYPPYVWNLLHYINVRYASLKTGKPVFDFLPSKKESDKLFKEMLNAEKNIKKKHGFFGGNE